MRVASDESPETFAPAPAGSIVRIATMIVAVVVTVVIAVAVWQMAAQSRRVEWVGVAVSLIVVAVVAGVWWAGRIRAYRLEGASLIVLRPMFPARIPLEALESAEIDREALRGAIRLFGNGGLGAISGRFRSRRLGSFRAYVSDGDKAVVLRAAGAVWVVSPDRPDSFVESVRRRSGAGKPPSAHS